MRRRHLAVTGGEIGAPGALRWHRIWQRRLWLRFLAAQLSRDPTAPWPRFRADGGLRVSIPLVLAGQLPRRGDRFLPDAVVSSLAEDVLRG